MASQDSPPPFGRLRIVDALRPLDGQRQVCEVLVEGEVVCELPIITAKWKLDPRSAPTVSVTTFAEHVEVEGHDVGQRPAPRRGYRCTECGSEDEYPLPRGTRFQCTGCERVTEQEPV